MRVSLERLGPIPPKQHGNWEQGASRSLWPIIRRIFLNEAHSVFSPPFPQLAGLPLNTPLPKQSSPFPLRNAPEECESGLSGD